jgi:predicted HTH domain antitoxin
MQVTIELPEDIGQQLVREWKDLPRAALEAVALEAYRAQKLSTEQLCRLLGFESRYDLDGFLKQHEIWLEYSLQDFEHEAEASARLWQKRQAEIEHGQGDGPPRT